jgi:hypothetical protein
MQKTEAMSNKCLSKEVIIAEILAENFPDVIKILNHKFEKTYDLT